MTSHGSISLEIWGSTSGLSLRLNQEASQILLPLLRFSQFCPIQLKQDEALVKLKTGTANVNT